MGDWKRKLTSRKFWAAVITWLASMLTAFNVADSVIVQVTTIVGGMGVLAAWLFAEAYVDGKMEADSPAGEKENEDDD